MNPSCFSWERGDWSDLAALRAILEGVRGHKYAAAYHDAIEGVLRDEGWQVAREWPIVFAEGRGGKIDIVARYCSTVIALELDNVTPRGKSILKLEAMPKHVPCAVLVRNPRVVFA